MVYAPAAGASSSNTTTVDATIADNRVVVSEFDPGALYGVYRASVRLADVDEIVRLSLNLILSVAANEFANVTGAVTLADIRMHMYDRLSSENELIEGQEFPDRLLYEGVRAAIRQWNDSGGSPNGYNPQNFPERNVLITGAVGWSLKSYQMLLARQQTGTPGQVSPEAPRLQAYSAIGNDLWRSFLIAISERMRLDDADEGFYFA